MSLASPAVVDARTALRDLLAHVGGRQPLELPAPVVASAHQTRAVREYLMWWITHPNPTGAFAARTGWLQWLPERLLLKAMFALGYDGLVYLDGDRVLAHVFFQRHGDSVHGFSTAVSPPFDRHGYSVVTLVDFVAHAARMPGVVRARVGQAQNNLTRRFRQRLQKYERHVGWRVEPDGWVSFVPRRSAEAERIFAEIYRRNTWGDPESRSGPGSGAVRTAALRKDLEALVRERDVHSLLDIPCGDFNWMKEATLPLDSYIGADIVTDLVRDNARKYGSKSRRFVRLDLTEDLLPTADLVLCRDGLVHLAFADIARARAGLKRSRSTYLLATTFTGLERNEDIETGDWRALNMEKAPFFFPPPLTILSDRRPDGSAAGKALALWRIADL